LTVEIVRLRPLTTGAAAEALERKQKEYASFLKALKQLQDEVATREAAIAARGEAGLYVLGGIEGNSS